jgi:hypothetical protein
MKKFGWNSEEELNEAVVGKVVYEPYSPQKVFFVISIECVPSVGCEPGNFTLTRVYAIDAKGDVVNLGGTVGSLEELIADHKKKISTHETRLAKMMEFGKTWLKTKK